MQCLKTSLFLSTNINFHLWWTNIVKKNCKLLKLYKDANFHCTDVKETIISINIPEIIGVNFLTFNVISFLTNLGNTSVV